MSSAVGRILGVAAGVVMIGLGARAGTTSSYILAIAGLVPLVFGIFNWCLPAPLLGVPFNVSELRRSQNG